MNLSDKIGNVSSKITTIHNTLWKSVNFDEAVDINATLNALSELHSSVVALYNEQVELERKLADEAENAGVVKFSPAVQALLESCGESAIEYANRVGLTEFQIGELETLTNFIKRFNHGIITKFSPDAVVFTMAGAESCNLVIGSEATMFVLGSEAVTTEQCNVLNAFADAVIHTGNAEAADGYELDPLLKLLFALRGL